MPCVRCGAIRDSETKLGVRICTTTANSMNPIAELRMSRRWRKRALKSSQTDISPDRFASDMGTVFLLTSATLGEWDTSGLPGCRSAPWMVGNVERGRHGNKYGVASRSPIRETLRYY